MATPSLNRVKSNGNNGKVLNRIQEETQRRKEEEARLQAEKEEKRKQRARQVSVEAERKRKEKEEAKKKEEEEQKEKKKEQSEKQKKLEEQRKQEQIKKKEQIQNFRSQQLDTKKKLEEEEQRKREESENKRKEENKAFLAKKTQEQKNAFDEKKKQREEEKTKSKETELLELEKEKKNKRKLETALREARKAREKEREANAQLHAMFKSENYQLVFKRHEKELDYLFKFYSAVFPDKSSMQDNKDIMSFKALMVFGSHFNIYPDVVSKENLKLAYRSVSKDLKIDGKTPVGINQDAFKELLLRVSAKNQPFCKNALKESQENGANERKSAKLSKPGNEEEAFRDISLDKSLVDEYSEIENMSPFTLEGLIVHLNLPEDRKQLADKLNGLRIENNPTDPIALSKSKENCKKLNGSMV